jgi:hypothetical protein
MTIPVLKGRFFMLQPQGQNYSTVCGGTLGVCWSGKQLQTLSPTEVPEKHSWGSHQKLAEEVCHQRQDRGSHKPKPSNNQALDNLFP